MSSADRPSSESGAPGGPPPPEAIIVHSRRVKCNGGGALGHPVVFYDMGDEAFVECLYCDRRFVYEPGPGGEAGH